MEQTIDYPSLTFFIRKMEPMDDPSSFFKMEPIKDLTCFFLRKAMLLSACRSEDLQEQEWTSWVLGRPLTAIRCDYAVPLTRGEAVDLKGNEVLYAKECRTSLEPDYLEITYENRVIMVLRDLDPQQRIPFFIGPHPEQVPVQYRVALEMRLEHFEQYPDIQARIAYHHSLDIYPLAREEAILTFQQQARLLTPGVKQYLPVMVRQGERDLPGVVYLQKKGGGFWKREPNRFVAVLYLSDTGTNLGSNTELFREVLWREGAVEKRCRIPVATVLEILEGPRSLSL